MDVLLSVVAVVAVAARIKDTTSTDEPDETVDVTKVDCVVGAILVDELEKVDAIETG